MSSIIFDPVTEDGIHKLGVPAVHVVLVTWKRTLQESNVPPMGRYHHGNVVILMGLIHWYSWVGEKKDNKTEIR